MIQPSERTELKKKIKVRDKCLFSVRFHVDSPVPVCNNHAPEYLSHKICHNLFMYEDSFET
jgi:hypothetical protein